MFFCGKKTFSSMRMVNVDLLCNQFLLLSAFSIWGFKVAYTILASGQDNLFILLKPRFDFVTYWLINHDYFYVIVCLLLLAVFIVFLQFIGGLTVNTESHLVKSSQLTCLFHCASLRSASLYFFC